MFDATLYNAELTRLADAVAAAMECNSPDHQAVAVREVVDPFRVLLSARGYDEGDVSIALQAVADRIGFRRPSIGTEAATMIQRAMTSRPEIHA